VSEISSGRNAKADVRQIIREEFDSLPEVYDCCIWEEKAERAFQFVYEKYASAAPAQEASRAASPISIFQKPPIFANLNSPFRPRA